MTLKSSKLGGAVAFIKYLAGVVSVIFLPSTLVWNKIKFSANFTEVKENELLKSIFKKLYQYSNTSQ